MKKIYLLILLVVSISFAADYQINLKSLRAISITNFTKKDLKGFKLYYYFNSRPVQNVSELGYEIARFVLNDAGTGGTIVPDASLQPKSVTFQRLSAIQYRVILDYSNMTIPANKVFPKSKNGYTTSDPLSIEIKNIGEGTRWAKPGHELDAYVLESLSGEVLASLNGSSRERKHPDIDKERRIGVLTSGTHCLGNGFAKYSPSWSVFAITIDAESGADISKTKIKSGSPLGIEIFEETVNKKKVKKVQFAYCTLAYETLPKTTYDYAVLSLDSLCPQGSYQVSRYHDTEDNSANHNQPTSATERIWPNEVNHDATLKYCYVPNQRGATLKYPINDSRFGVFAGPRSNLGSNYIATSQVYIKDESNMNQNEWNYRSVPTHLQSGFQAIMNGSNYTEYNVIKWTGSENQMLSKSAAEVADAPISKGQPLVTAVPLAPAIKGLSRSAVAVELKSAGDVKVSIVGVNGAVIANIAEKGLLAGAHQIKWNAGMVPSGRYVVKVEQNGMVNAKNVILK